MNGKINKLDGRSLTVAVGRRVGHGRLVQQHPIDLLVRAHAALRQVVACTMIDTIQFFFFIFLIKDKDDR